jgi:hypothetical protein
MAQRDRGRYSRRERENRGWQLEKWRPGRMAAAPTTRPRLGLAPRCAWEATGPRAGEQRRLGRVRRWAAGKGAQPAHDEREGRGRRRPGWAARRGTGPRERGRGFSYLFFLFWL